MSEEIKQKAREAEYKVVDILGGYAKTVDEDGDFCIIINGEFERDKVVTTISTLFDSLLSQALQKRDEAIIKMLENTDVQMSVNGDVSKDEIAMAKFIYKAHIRHIIKKIESAITPPNSINGTLPSDTDSATK